MNLLYFDCLAGVSADMVVGALLDMGVSATGLARELSKVSLGAVYDIEAEKVERGGIGATAFHVYVQESSGRYVLSEVAELVLKSDLEVVAKRLAVNFLECYIRAHAEVLACEREEVFLEGDEAVCTLVNLLAAAIGLSYMGADCVVSSPITEGSGIVQTKNGLMRVPVPVVMEMLREAGAPIEVCPEQTQLITPSGAAIVCALSEQFDELPSMTIRSIGFGAGRKELDTRANVFRLVLGQNEERFFEKSISVVGERSLWQQNGFLTSCE